MKGEVGGLAVAVGQPASVPSVQVGDPPAEDKTLAQSKLLLEVKKGNFPMGLLDESGVCTHLGHSRRGGPLPCPGPGGWHL